VTNCLHIRLPRLPSCSLIVFSCSTLSCTSRDNCGTVWVSWAVEQTEDSAVHWTVPLGECYTAHFDSECNTIVRNVGDDSPNDTMLHRKMFASSAAPLWKLAISRNTDWLLRSCSDRLKNSSVEDRPSCEGSKFSTVKFPTVHGTCSCSALSPEPATGPDPEQMNDIHAIPSYFPNIDSNTVLRYPPIPAQWSRSCTFPRQNCVSIWKFEETVITCECTVKYPLCLRSTPFRHVGSAVAFWSSL